MEEGWIRVDKEWIQDLIYWKGWIKDELRMKKEIMKDEIYSKGWISDELRIYEGWKMLKRMD